MEHQKRCAHHATTMLLRSIPTKAMEERRREKSSFRDKNPHKKHTADFKFGFHGCFFLQSSLNVVKILTRLNREGVPFGNQPAGEAGQVDFLAPPPSLFQNNVYRMSSSILGPKKCSANQSREIPQQPPKIPILPQKRPPPLSSLLFPPLFSFM